MGQQQLSMHRAPLPEHLTKGSFSLRASDKAGVSRTRTEAKDLATVSRGIRMYLGSEAAGAAALRAYTELDDASVLSFGSAARVMQAGLPAWLEDDWRVHVAPGAVSACLEGQTSWVTSSRCFRTRSWSTTASGSPRLPGPGWTWPRF
jgi:hypothetical protein